MLYLNAPKDLFSDRNYSLQKILLDGLKGIEGHINSIHIQKLKTLVPQNVIEGYLTGLKLDVPVIDQKSLKPGQEEVQISGQNRQGSLTTRFFYSYTFSGNEKLFDCAPETNRIHAFTRARLQDNRLEILFEYDTLTNIDLASRAGTELGRVLHNLESLRLDVERLKQKISAHGASIISTRLARENRAEEILKASGNF